MSASSAHSAVKGLKVKLILCDVIIIFDDLYTVAVIASLSYKKLHFVVVLVS